MSRPTPSIKLAAVGLAALLALCAPVAAAEWLPAEVELSDGTRMEGRVQLTDDSLIILNEAQARRYAVRAAEIARLETVVERQSMEAKWIFRESGLDDKVYTGEQYPVREYLTRVTFHDGRVLEGHIMPRTLYVEGGGGRQRFILRRKDEGEVGRGLDDLLYVRSVLFKSEGAGVRGTIEGTLHLPEGETLRKVLAVNRDKLFSVEALINPASGAFRVSDATEGTYDLLVLSNRAIYLCFSRERDPGAAAPGASAGAPLNAAQVHDVQSWVDRLRDFFHSQTIVYAAGDADRLFALVRKERRGGTTSQEAQHIRAYDVWAMHRPHDEWQIEKRMFFTRAVNAEAMPPLEDVVIAPDLAGHVVSPGAADLKLDIALTRNAEPPIPPAPAGRAAAPVNGQGVTHGD